MVLYKAVRQPSDLHNAKEHPDKQLQAQQWKANKEDSLWAPNRKVRGV